MFVCYVCTRNGTNINGTNVQILSENKCTILGYSRNEHKALHSILECYRCQPPTFILFKLPVVKITTKYVPGRFKAFVLKDGLLLGPLDWVAVIIYDEILRVALVEVFGSRLIGDSGHSWRRPWAGGPAVVILGMKAFFFIQTLSIISTKVLATNSSAKKTYIQVLAD